MTESIKIEEEINPYSTIKPANQKKLQKHLQAVAKILYQEAENKELESLAGIVYWLFQTRGCEACYPCTFDLNLGNIFFVKICFGFVEPRTAYP
ncbi:hypothetical protein [Nostoc sp.]|uniref:hypothetical protein n=1 Tax=Nostoc sp. TaxID=1180 RepID=UPI002FFC6357